MNKLQTTLACGAALTAAFASFSVSAKVSEAEAAKLGAELTMVGAERAGNADGTIPEYEGAAFWTDKEKSYTYNEIEAMSKETQAELLLGRVKGEEPLFTITAANVGEHADKLSEGHNDTPLVN
jgi:hypothetical protein